jgi:hypothetical protein
MTESSFPPAGDEPETLQLRRPIPPGPAHQPTPMPGPLDLTATPAAPAGPHLAEPVTEPVTEPVAAEDQTAVLPLDALLDRSPGTDSRVPIIAPSAGYAEPVAAPHHEIPRPVTAGERPVSEQLRADAEQRLRELRHATTRWMDNGDNKLILATVAVLILLVLAVALG